MFDCASLMTNNISFLAGSSFEGFVSFISVLSYTMFQISVIQLQVKFAHGFTIPLKGLAFKSFELYKPVKYWATFYSVFVGINLFFLYFQYATDPYVTTILLYIGYIIVFPLPAIQSMIISVNLLKNKTLNSKLNIYLFFTMSIINMMFCSLNVYLYLFNTVIVIVN